MNSPAAEALLCPWWTQSGKLNINFKEFLWWFMFYKFRSVVKFYFLSLDQRNWQTLRALWWQSLFSSAHTRQKSFVVRDFYRNTNIGSVSCLSRWDMSKCQRACAHVGLHIGLDDADRIRKSDPFNFYIVQSLYQTELDKLTT